MMKTQVHLQLSRWKLGVSFLFESTFLYIRHRRLFPERSFPALSMLAGPDPQKSIVAGWAPVLL